MKLTTGQAVAALRPGAEWVMYGDDLARLTMLTPGVTVPTQEEVNAWLASH